MLIASHFSEVYNRRNSTSCENLVKQIVYPQTIIRSLQVLDAFRYGLENEKLAIMDFEFYCHTIFNYLFIKLFLSLSFTNFFYYR